MQTNPFIAEPQYFQAGRKEYKLEFIPSEHFSAILVEVLSMTISLQSGPSALPVEVDPMVVAFREAAGNILKNQVYELMADVINYQNEGPKVSSGQLRKSVSLVEMTQFVGAVINHDELLAAVEEFVEAAGKLMETVPGKVTAIKEKVEKLRDRLPTEKFTPSSVTTSDTTDTQ